MKPAADAAAWSVTHADAAFPQVGVNQTLIRFEVISIDRLQLAHQLDPGCDREQPAQQLRGCLGFRSVVPQHVRDDRVEPGAHLGDVCRGQSGCTISRCVGSFRSVGSFTGVGSWRG